MLVPLSNINRRMLRVFRLKAASRRLKADKS